MQSGAGRISAGGVVKEVRFVKVDPNAAVHDSLDAAYKTKYEPRSAAYVPPMLTAGAREATLRIDPA